MNLFGHRVKLPPISTSLTTQKYRQSRYVALPIRTQQANLPAYLHTNLLNAERQAGKL